MQNILRIILSIEGGIPNVKRHVETDGGKQLYNTEAGLKELKQSRESDLDLILNRNIFSELSWDWEILRQMGNFREWCLIGYCFLHPFYMLNQLFNHLITYNS